MSTRLPPSQKPPFTLQPETRLIVRDALISLAIAITVVVAIDALWWAFSDHFIFSTVAFPD
jgi:hypothetical protein